MSGPGTTQPSSLFQFRWRRGLIGALLIAVLTFRTPFFLVLGECCYVLWLAASAGEAWLWRRANGR